MCLGVASDRAGADEVWLSSQNRNFANRMGKGSIAWLASAATVAASSLTLEIADPRRVLCDIDQDRYGRLLDRQQTALPAVTHSQPSPAPHAAVNAGAKATSSASEPRVIEGRIQRFGDHIDTDAIIPGEFCHLTDLAELGRVCFRHVRPEFHERVQQGRTIVVGGEGWGSGSSREQAAWALKGAGVQAVIAMSFAFIHKRNLVNEALPFLVVTDRAFYQQAEEGAQLRLDLAAGTVQIAPTGETFQAAPSSPMVNALSRAGGIVDAIRRYGSDTFAHLQNG